MQLGDTTACDCRGRVLVCGASSGGVHGESGNSTSELSAMTGEQTTANAVSMTADLSQNNLCCNQHTQCDLLDEEMKTCTCTLLVCVMNFLV